MSAVEHDERSLRIARKQFDSRWQSGAGESTAHISFANLPRHELAKLALAELERPDSRDRDRRVVGLMIPQHAACEILQIALENIAVIKTRPDREACALAGIARGKIVNKLDMEIASGRKNFTVPLGRNALNNICGFTV